LEIQINDEGQQGSLEKGLSGDYELSLGTWLKEAWGRVDGNKGTIWMAMLFYVGLAALISIFFGLLDGGPTDPNSIEPPSFIEMIGNLVSALVLLPMGVGLAFVATAIALDKTPNPKSLLGWYDNTLKLFFTYILMNVLILVGLLLFVLPGIYLMVSYQIALPLVVDKKLGPWEALEASRKVIGHNWFQVFGYDIVAVLVLMLSSVLLGIPLIWTVPAMVIAYGILYRTAVGIEPQTLHRTTAS
jgi:hypothetical protein